MLSQQIRAFKILSSYTVREKKRSKSKQTHTNNVYYLQSRSVPKKSSDLIQPEVRTVFLRVPHGPIIER